MDILEIVKMILPAVAVLITAIVILKNQNEVALENVRLELRKSQVNTFSPLKLQAYERFALFLERNNLVNLLNEYTDANFSANGLKQSIVLNIQNEFKHNVAQQIYVSSQAYNVIKVSKEETIMWVQQAAEQLEPDAKATDLVAKLIETTKEKGYIPTDKALAFLKSEVSLYFQ